MADDEQRVRQLAYRIWESEGRPDGQAQRHWDMAWKIVAAERAAGHEAELDAPAAPKKARATKASSRPPAKASSKTTAKGTSKAGTSTRKGPAAHKATQAETTQTEASKKRTRPSSRDKTPRPGDE